MISLAHLVSGITITCMPFHHSPKYINKSFKFTYTLGGQTITNLFSSKNSMVAV